MTDQFSPRRYYKYEAIIRYARQLGFGEIHTKLDTKTGLNAIIAIHSTKLGPAIGGTRCFNYSSTGPAIIDALRLAYIMTLKAAVSDLPHGGAKAVLLKPRKILDRKAYFQAYGNFVHEMGGRYIAAVDIGTSSEDMNTIAERTPYVFGANKIRPIESDPSPHTAMGVLHGIQAAVKHRLHRDTLEDIHVAIQGAGHVGYYLSKLLYERGARITITDPKPESTQRCVDEFNANVVSVDQIFDVPCDVFSPSAVSNIINFDNLHRLKAKIVAGSANAQLAHRKYAEVMKNKGILYAPDFVINSGGLIFAAMVYDFQDQALAEQKISQLYQTMLNIFERADITGQNTLQIAELIAKERLKNNNTGKVTESDYV